MATKHLKMPGLSGYVALGLKYDELSYKLFILMDKIIFWDLLGQIHCISKYSYYTCF